LLTTELRFLRNTVSLVWTQAESMMACNSSPQFSLLSASGWCYLSYSTFCSLFYFSFLISSAFLHASSIIWLGMEGSWLTM
jgi:hypothetical protein